jgi:hypothetical protein
MNLIRQAIYVLHNIETRSRNHFCRVKAINIVCSEGVSVAFGVHHAVRMSRIVLPSVARSAVQYFYALSHKRQDLRKKKKFVQWKPSCSIGTDRRADMTDLIVAFRNFADAANNRSFDQGSNRLLHLYSHIAIQYNPKHLL